MQITIAQKNNWEITEFWVCNHHSCENGDLSPLGNPDCQVTCLDLFQRYPCVTDASRGHPYVRDPCGTNPESGAAPSATQAQCANTGLAASLYGSDLNVKKCWFCIQNSQKWLIFDLKLTE